MRYQIWKPVNIYSSNFIGYRVYYVQLKVDGEVHARSLLFKRLAYWRILKTSTFTRGRLPVIKIKY